jgi:hypothetical protein
MSLLRTVCVLALTVTNALLASSRCDAQGWIVAAGAGHSVHEPVQSRSGATAVHVGVAHQGFPWLYVAAGAPLDSAGFPWGALGLGGRFSTPGSGISLGVDLGAQGFGFVDRIARRGGGGLTVEDLPVLALGADRLDLEIRSGMVHFGSAYADQFTGRTIHQTDARLVLHSDRFRVAGESRYLRATEADYSYLGASIQARLDRAVVSGHVGRWISPHVPTPVWGASARIRVAAATDAQLSLQQETNDPLYWTAPRRSWSVGFSRRIGSVPLRAGFVPAAVTADGGVTIRLPASSSVSDPRIAGDFSGWQELPMARTGEVWSVTLPLQPGSYRYAFRSADGAWFVPEEHPGREPDGYGGYNAVLVVQ